MAAASNCPADASAAARFVAASAESGSRRAASENSATASSHFPSRVRTAPRPLVGPRILGLQSKRIRIPRHRFIEPTGVGQRISQVVRRLGKVGPQTQRLRQMADRFICLMPAPELGSEVVVRERVRLIDPQGFGEVRDRLLVPALVGERQAQSSLGDLVGGGRLGRVLPEREAVLPVQRLRARLDREGANRQHDCPSQRRTPPRMSNGNLAHQPGTGDEHADQRDVRIPVCPRLTADLDDTDDRHERSDVPQPSNEKVWMPPRGPYARSGR